MCILPGKDDMDTKQIEYILKIAEENNITKAADKLYITQSALNQQLLKLEKELGTPLFHRSRVNWRPTEAGEVYLRNARQILRLKKDTDQRYCRHQAGTPFHWLYSRTGYQYVHLHLSGLPANLPGHCGGTCGKKRL